MDKNEERNAVRANNRLFTAFARKFSYASAVAFNSLSSAFLAAFYAYFFAVSILEMRGYALRVTSFSLLVGVLFWSFVHYTHFGLLRPLGFPGFGQVIRRINTLVHQYDPFPADSTISSDDLLRLHEDIDRFPLRNMKMTAFYTMMLILGIIIVYLVAVRKPSDVPVFLAAGAIGMTVHVSFAFIISEHLTQPLRLRITQLLSGRDVVFHDHPILSLKIKAYFLLVLMVLNIIVLAVFLGSGRKSALDAAIFIAASMVTHGLVIFFFLRSINVSLGQINMAASQLASGESGLFFPAVTDREIVQFSRHYNAAAREIASLRKDLERRIDLRTAELGAAVHEAQEASRAAEAANRAKSTFLANMSHELRTPLNAVLGYSEILMEEAEDLGHPEFVPDLKKIYASGKHLLDLINDILDVSKIEAGRMELFLETFEVAPLLRNVIETARPLLEKGNNTLRTDLRLSDRQMTADQTKVRQILFNLLSNAAKFTENGTITLESWVEEEGGRSRIAIRVTDTGIGMAADQVKILFQAFTQADASATRKYGGSGLGLAITRHFCRMMGGEITVESELQKGSSFTVRLPVDVTESAGSGLAAAAASPASTGAKSRILVIDDEAASRDLIKRTLSKDGYDVVLAKDGAEGLRLARDIKPDIITLDVIMPGMDGWAVLKALKAEPATADIPVIMLTFMDNRPLGMSLGAADYLGKPIDRFRLLTILRKYQKDHEKCLALIVEDNAETRDLLRRTMEKEGWSVREAENGRAALDRVADKIPNLILLDLLMPYMNGFEFVAELRKNELWKSIPVIVITAKDLTAEDRMRLNGYVEMILQKGAFGQDELIEEIRTLVSDCAKQRLSNKE